MSFTKALVVSGMMPWKKPWVRMIEVGISRARNHLRLRIVREPYMKRWRCMREHEGSLERMRPCVEWKANAGLQVNISISSKGGKGKGPKDACNYFESHFDRLLKVLDDLQL